MKLTHVTVVMSIFLTLPFTLPFLYTILSYHTDTYLKEFSWKSIDCFLKKWYSIDILQSSNVYVKN